MDYFNILNIKLLKMIIQVQIKIKLKFLVKFGKN
jgi:hypothetical protein